ncbi:MAG: 3-dehydroquinate synthase [Firmicutes bacterium]|nr:3-dehydroquinate synthase [Bacillota bacterium]
MQQLDFGGEVRKTVSGDTIVVVTDENVKPLYLDRYMQNLQSVGFDVYSFTIAPGEESKSGEVYLELLNYLAEIPLTRADALVALGGGVVGDLTGFAAATYLRGIKVIQVPTTVLAVVDSSIGGKTAINLPAGKNLAGAFHQPALIWRDVTMLESLPADTYLNGMAEVIKYGVLADADLWSLLLNYANVQNNMPEIIDRCVSIKNRIVAEDEFDTGTRQLLNFGHTIGHAIERASDFAVSHGFAVAKGMAAIADISARQGWCSRECAQEIIQLLENYGFDLSIDYSMDELYNIMLSDKKRKGGVIDLVVPERIGKCVLKRLTTEELKGIL